MTIQPLDLDILRVLCPMCGHEIREARAPVLVATTLSDIVEARLIKLIVKHEYADSFNEDGTISKSALGALGDVKRVSLSRRKAC